MENVGVHRDAMLWIAFQVVAFIDLVYFKEIHIHLMIILIFWFDIAFMIYRKLHPQHLKQKSF